MLWHKHTTTIFPRFYDDEFQIKTRGSVNNQKSRDATLEKVFFVSWESLSRATKQTLLLIAA